MRMRVCCQLTDHYIINRKLLDSIFSILAVLYAAEKLKKKNTGNFFCKVSYTRCDMPWFIEKMDFLLFQKGNLVYTNGSGKQNRVNTVVEHGLDKV
jgi:hypothetical protein